MTERPEDRTLPPDETEHPHDDPDARSSTKEAQKEDPDAVEEASRDSFPSSDPPAW